MDDDVDDGDEEGGFKEPWSLLARVDSWKEYGVEGGEEDKGASLEGKQVWVGGEEDGELKTLKMLEVRTTGSWDLMLFVNGALDLPDISV